MKSIITEERYEDLKSRLRRYSDILEVSRETGIPEESLLVIYTQQVTRDATRRYYRVKSRARKFYHQWRSGKPLMKFSLENRFPPILTALIILQEGDFTRKGRQAPSGVKGDCSERPHLLSTGRRCSGGARPQG